MSWNYLKILSAVAYKSGAQHAGCRKPGCGPLDPPKCVFWHTTVVLKTSYLFIGAFLHKHGYECKKFAVVSGKRHQLQGDFVPLTP